MTPEYIRSLAPAFARFAAAVEARPDTPGAREAVRLARRFDELVRGSPARSDAEQLLADIRSSGLDGCLVDEIEIALGIVARGRLDS